MKRKTPNVANSPPGTAATELAVLLPLLLLLALGCVDFGRISYYSIALSSAAGAGAAHAATHRFTQYSAPSWEAQVRQAVVEEMQYVPDFAGDALTIDIKTASVPDQAVRVTVRAAYPFSTTIDWPGMPSTLVLHRQFTAIQYR